jgi:site-specific DNA-cytosine methylase
MSLGYSVPTKGLTSDGFSMKWSNSGMAYRGELWTLDTSESPNDADECSLSQVLNPTAPARFSLSAKAASGILRRAEVNGKRLPAGLRIALQKVAEGTIGLEVRRLTPTECERLMGWPDGWTLSERWKHSEQKHIENFKREIGRLA